ncbi:MAG: hypothetical protein ABIJ56_10495 [Pseudomonadota bacterium]
MGRNTSTTLLLSSIAVILAGCWLSTPPRPYRADAGEVDAAADTAVPDVPPDMEPESWQFVDRDIPDRNIPVNLLFAAVPSVAWNGSTAGLVYRGMGSGENTEYAGFIPLDARGNVIGDEKILAEYGVVGGFPLIAAADDGNFLFSTLIETPYDHVLIARVSPEGEILNLGATPDYPGFNNPLSPPVRAGDFVFVATGARGTYQDEIHIYRFTWSGLVQDRAVILGMGDFGDGDPVIRNAPDSSNVLLFFRNSATSISIDEYSPDLELAGLMDPIEFDRPISSYAAAANSSNWFLYAANHDYEESELILSCHASDGAWATGGMEAELYGYFLRACASDFPSWGGTVSVYFNDRWSIWVDIYAGPTPSFQIGARIPISDDVESRRMDDIPWTDIAWTDNGFLVVWDQWRMDYAYSVFSSFIALEPEY